MTIISIGFGLVIGIVIGFYLGDQHAWYWYCQIKKEWKAIEDIKDQRIKFWKDKYYDR